MKTSTKRCPEGREEGRRGASRGELSRAAMASSRRGNTARALPRHEWSHYWAHGVAEVEAELQADAIEE
jgi:hypothetical protein